MPAIHKREPITYKKPRRINSVSVTLTLILAVLVYLGYCFYPNFILAGNVKEIMRSELLPLYQINLAKNKRALADFRKKLFIQIQKAGVTDPELKVTADGDAKMVFIAVQFQSTVNFEWLDKTMIWHHNPRVETSAERVEW